MPRSRRRNTRRTSPRRSPSRRRRTTKLRLYTAQTGTMPERTMALSVKVNVGRNKMATTRDSAYMACATFGKRTECSESDTAARAVGNALSKVGSKTASSSVSLSGLAASRKRRRKSRR